MQGVRILLRALAEGKADAPEDIIARWTWRLARATRKLQDRRASAELPDAKRLLGALANSRGHRHEENVARLVNVALEQPVQVGGALLASAEGYTPTAQQLIERARERLGTIAAGRRRAGREPARTESAEQQVPPPPPPQEAAQVEAANTGTARGGERTATSPPETNGAEPAPRLPREPPQAERNGEPAPAAGSAPGKGEEIALT